MQSKFNAKDREQWEKIFQSPNPDWKNVPEQVFMRDALEFYRSLNVSTVLDIGCGVGVWSFYLARHRFSVFGADFSQNAINLCIKLAEEEKLDVRFEVAPITVDPFPGQRFDAALAAMVLDNVAPEEMKLAISILKTKLNPGGALFALFNPLLTDEQKQEIIRSSSNPTSDITSITYSDEEIKNSFKGFEIVNFKKYPLQGLDFRGIALRKI